MGSTCPLEIAQYSKCVLRNTDSLDKGVCAKEFEALRKCFVQARGKGKK